MCSSCNKTWKEIRENKEWEYLSNDQVTIILLHEILEQLKQVNKK